MGGSVIEEEKNQDRTIPPGPGSYFLFGVFFIRMRYGNRLPRDLTVTVGAVTHVWLLLTLKAFGIKTSRLNPEKSLSESISMANALILKSYIILIKHSLLQVHPSKELLKLKKQTADNSFCTPETQTNVLSYQRK